MCYSVPKPKGAARGLRDTITIDTEYAHGLTDLDPTFHWLTKSSRRTIIATVNLATVISLQCLKSSYLRLC